MLVLLFFFFRYSAFRFIQSQHVADIGALEHIVRVRGASLWLWPRDIFRRFGRFNCIFAVRVGGYLISAQYFGWTARRNCRTNYIVKMQQSQRTAILADY